MANEGGDVERLVVLLEARLSDFEKNMMKAAGISERQFNAMRQQSRGAAAQMEADMARASSRIDQLLAGTSTRIGSFGKAFLGGFAGGMFAGGIEGFVSGVRTIVSDLAAMQKQIERVGISAKAFQELKYGFESVGVSSSSFVDGLDTFNRKIADAATKGGRLADILKANGVAIRDHNGQIRSAEALLRDYADLVKNAGSEQERMLLVTEAFGSGDRAFVNALKNGADGIDEMGRAAERAGGTIDAELIKRADELDSRWSDAWRNFEINGKAALMNVIGLFDQFKAKYAEFEQKRNAAILGAEAGALAGSLVGGGDGIELPSTAPTPTTRPTKPAKTTIIPGKKSTGTKAIKKTADDVFGEDIDRIKDRIAAMKEEQAILGLSYFEQQKRTMSLQLEQKALDDVREAARRKGDVDWKNKQLSDEQRATIDQVSEAYARQADELRKATQLQQLQQDILRGAFDDLRSALESGELSWRTFAEIALHALDRIIEKIETDLIDAIMQANSAGGGGGLLGEILGAIGIGSAPAASSFSFPAGMGLWDTGGYTGPGGRKQVAGLVHKGEVVWSQDDVRRAGGVAAVEGMRHGGGLAIPAAPVAARQDTAHVTVGVSVDENGNLQAYVKEISRSEAAQAVGQGIKQFAASPAFTVSTSKSLRALKTTSGSF